MKTGVFYCGLVLIVFTGCSQNNAKEDGDTEQTCVPGATEKCDCADTAIFETRTCDDTGRWMGSCECIKDSETVGTATDPLTDTLDKERPTTDSDQLPDDSATESPGETNTDSKTDTASDTPSDTWLDTESDKAKDTATNDTAITESDETTDTETEKQNGHDTETARDTEDDTGKDSATEPESDTGTGSESDSDTVEQVLCSSTSCHPEATCEDSTGTIVCTCNYGWIGDGRTCEIIVCDPLAVANADIVCSAAFEFASDCAITCQSGYQPDNSGASNVTCSSTGAWSLGPMGCDDVDECANSTASCPAHAQCENSVGAYQCPCDNGWAGSSCDRCNEGFYGADCAPCSCVNGVCADGLSGDGSCSECPPGWTGANCQQCRFYVDGAGGSDDNDGAGWSDAFKSIQKGLDAAGAEATENTGCDVWVKGNLTYFPGTASEDSFKLKNYVGVYGGFAGVEDALNQRDIKGHPTRLSGDLSQNDGEGIASEILSCNDADGCTHDVTLDGLVITNGGDNTSSGGAIRASRSTTLDLQIRNCEFYNHSNITGGAIYFTGNSIHIQNCIFNGNSATDKSGAAHLGGDSLIEDTIFIGNHSVKDGAAVGAYGDVVTIRNCRFEENTGPNAALYVGTSILPTVEDSYFARNAGTGGMGINTRNAKNMLINRCLFEDNSGPAVQITGDSLDGVDFRDKIATVANSTIRRNATASANGAIFTAGAHTRIENSLVYDNAGRGVRTYGEGVTDVLNSTIAHNKTGGVTAETNLSSARTGSATITNSVVWGNSSSNVVGNIGNFTIINSIVGGVSTVDGSIDADPQFVSVDLSTGVMDLRLGPCSPGIDLGNGLYETAVDFSGSPRMDWAPADNCGPGEWDPQNCNWISDMGAYEFTGVDMCNDHDACTADEYVEAGCSFACSHSPVTSCVTGDDCCPPACDASEDADCSALCGNGVLDGEESCDGDCPVDCDDGNSCTADSLVGYANHCDARCEHKQNYECVGGDGCCPDNCVAGNDSDCTLECHEKMDCGSVGVYCEDNTCFACNTATACGPDCDTCGGKQPFCGGEDKGCVCTDTSCAAGERCDAATGRCIRCTTSSYCGVGCIACDNPEFPKCANMGAELGYQCAKCASIQNCIDLYGQIASGWECQLGECVPGTGCVEELYDPVCADGVTVRECIAGEIALRKCQISCWSFGCTRYACEPNDGWAICGCDDCP